MAKEGLFSSESKQWAAVKMCLLVITLPVHQWPTLRSSGKWIQLLFTRTLSHETQLDIETRKNLCLILELWQDGNDFTVLTQRRGPSPEPRVGGRPAQYVCVLGSLAAVVARGLPPFFVVFIAIAAHGEVTPGPATWILSWNL